MILTIKMLDTFPLNLRWVFAVKSQNLREFFTWNMKVSLNKGDCVDLYYMRTE